MSQVEDAANQLAIINDKQVELQSKIMQATAEFQGQLQDLQQQDLLLRASLEQAMRENERKEYEDDNIRVVLVAPTTRKGIDLKKLQMHEPEIYQKYEKVTNVKGSVRITLKNKG